MASAKLKDAVEAWGAALFAGDARVVFETLRNRDLPDPPAMTRAELAKAYVFASFASPTKEEAVGIGGPSIAWEEAGAFILYVLTGSKTGDALVDEIYATATKSLRGRTIGAGDDVDILSMFGDDGFGPRANGNWWGRSVAVEFEAQNI